MGFLRIILALAVVFAHSPIGAFSWHPLIPGELAVEMFFMISGFYMSLVLTEKYKDPNGNTDKKSFWTARALRIYPYYWAALAILIAFYARYVLRGVLSLDPLIDQGGWVALWLTFSNIFLFGLDGLLFVANGPEGLHPLKALGNAPGIQPYHLITIAPAWTLSLELMFYLLAPYINRLHSWKIAGLIFLSVILRAAAYSQGLTEDPWGYRFFPFELTFFLSGMLMHRAYHKELLRSPLLMIPLICLIIAYPWLPITKIQGFWLEGSILLIAGALALPSLFNKTKNWAFDRKIGNVSYPLYVLHMPVIIILAVFPQYIVLDSLEKTAVITLISLISAYILDFIVETAVAWLRKGKFKPSNDLAAK